MQSLQTDLLKERSGTIFKLKIVDTDSKDGNDRKETETSIALKDDLLLEFGNQIKEWNKDTEKLKLMTDIDDEKKQNEQNIVINAQELFNEYLECTQIMNIQSERVLKASSSLMIKLMGKNNILHV